MSVQEGDPVTQPEFWDNTYLRENRIISELVDVLAGGVPKTVFRRHYLGDYMRIFSSQVLNLENGLEESLLNPVTFADFSWK